MKKEEYLQIINQAKIDAIKAAIAQAKPGISNLFITFYTTANGVVISDILRAKYPQQMTIVMHNRFCNLKVLEKKFSVQLKFSGVEENIVIPFYSITYFLDKECNFELSFDNEPNSDGNDKTSDANGNQIASSRPKIIDISAMIKK